MKAMLDKESLEKVMQVYFASLNAAFERLKHIKQFIEGSFYFFQFLTNFFKELSRKDEMIIKSKGITGSFLSVKIKYNELLM